MQKQKLREWLTSLEIDEAVIQLFEKEQYTLLNLETLTISDLEELGIKKGPKNLIWRTLHPEWKSTSSSSLKRKRTLPMGDSDIEFPKDYNEDVQQAHQEEEYESGQEDNVPNYLIEKRKKNKIIKRLVSKIPSDVLPLIFSYLDFKDLLEGVQLVCENWKNSVFHRTSWIGKTLVPTSKMTNLFQDFKFAPFFSSLEISKKGKFNLKFFENTRNLENLKVFFRVTLFGILRSTLHLNCNSLRVISLVVPTATSKSFLKGVSARKRKSQKHKITFSSLESLVIKGAKSSCSFLLLVESAPKLSYLSLIDATERYIDTDPFEPESIFDIIGSFSNLRSLNLSLGYSNLLPALFQSCYSLKKLMFHLITRGSTWNKINSILLKLKDLEMTHLEIGLDLGKLDQMLSEDKKRQRQEEGKIIPLVMESVQSLVFFVNCWNCFLPPFPIGYFSNVTHFFLSVTSGNYGARRKIYLSELLKLLREFNQLVYFTISPEVFNWLLPYKYEQSTIPHDGEDAASSSSSLSSSNEIIPMENIKTLSISEKIAGFWEGDIEMPQVLFLIMAFPFATLQFKLDHAEAQPTDADKLKKIWDVLETFIDDFTTNKAMLSVFGNLLKKMKEAIEAIKNLNCLDYITAAVNEHQDEIPSDQLKKIPYAIPLWSLILYHVWPSKHQDFFVSKQKNYKRLEL